jgi:hypothetical protein
MAVVTKLRFSGQSNTLKLKYVPSPEVPNDECSPVKSAESTSPVTTTRSSPGGAATVDFGGPGLVSPPTFPECSHLYFFISCNSGNIMEG